MAESMVVEVEPRVQANVITRKRDEVHTQDGSVDCYGRHSIKGKTGGWGVGILLLVNQGLATLAFYGVGANLVLFMTRVLQQDNAEAANNVSNWTGTAYIFSLVGAFVSDSYWGRYRTCAVFQLIFVSGLVELSLSSYLLLLRPCVPDGKPDCPPPRHFEIWIFYISIYQIALGNGAYQPAVAAFGADQFDEEDPVEGQYKVAFFSYFYLANNLGTLFSYTILAYIEDKGEWVLSFWISAGAAFMALVMFLAGTPRFRHFKPGGNPLSRVCQVIVASIKKRRVEMPSEGEDLYELEGKQCTINGGRKILHTPDFRFLDRAAVIRHEDFFHQEQQHSPNPWSLCTVTQVEELKCILRLIPIWLCTITYSVVYTQMASVFVEQGASMKTTISAFHIPPASISIFEILGVTVFILLYRLCFIPWLNRLQKGDSKCLTELQRMGVGLIVSAITMVAAGIVEYQRLKYARNDSSTLSILWQTPQYVLIGASEVFMYVGQLEFFNNQTPNGLKSFGSALYVLSMSVGNYLSSLLLTVVMDITHRGQKKGWISENLNKGHMERFYFLLAVLSAIDFVIFVACARWYRRISLEGKPEIIETNNQALGHKK